MKILKLAFYQLKSKMNVKGEAPIYFRITYKYEQITLSTEIFITPDFWDRKKAKVKSKHPRSYYLNNNLIEITNKVDQIFYDLIRENEEISIQKIKSILRNKSIKKNTLFSIYDYFISSIEARIGKGYSTGTIKHYKTNKRKMADFIKEVYNYTDLNLDKLNYEFITRFEAFLGNHYGNKINTIHKEIKRLKAIINMAIKLEWLKENPFKNYKGKTEQTNRQYLTELELNKIENVDLNGLHRLSTDRDIFLFMVYTGLSYSDISKLNNNDIQITIEGKQYIQSERQKTNERFIIPIFENAKVLIEKYKNHPESINKGILFPVISNQKMNKNLKLIAEKINLSKPLTCHVARHTFATLALENNVPLETVSKLLGHSNIATTQIYAKVTKTKINKDCLPMEKLWNNKPKDQESISQKIV